MNGSHRPRLGGILLRARCGVPTDRDDWMTRTRTNPMDETIGLLAETVREMAGMAWIRR
jgi:hypothetical protein